MRNLNGYGRPSQPWLCAWAVLVLCAAHVARAADSPVLVRDIETFPNAGIAFGPSATAGGAILFARSRPDTGAELWITDLTPAGTRLVRDVRPGPFSSNIQTLVAAGSLVIFAANDGTHGEEPWISDGTEAGTVMLADLDPAGDSSPADFVIVDDTVVFAATVPTTGRELYAVDLVTRTTGLFRDLRLGPDGASPRSIIAFTTGAPAAAGLYMAGDLGGGPELLRLPLTAGSLPTALEVNPSLTVGSFPSVLTVAGDRFFLTANDGGNGNELFVSDGLTVTLVEDLAPGSASSGIFALEPLGNRVVFRATSPALGSEPRSSDGTPDAVVDFDITPGPDGSFPNGFTTFGSEVFFFAASPAGGVELFRTNGTALTPLPESVPGPGSAFPESGFTVLVPTASALFFAADDPANGRELYRTDGSTITLVRDLFPGPAGGSPFLLAALGDALFFQAEDAAVTSLWSSDGSSAGTRPFLDLSTPGSRGSGPSDLFTVGDRLVFAAATVARGDELWVSDGTTAGTDVLFEIEPGNRTTNGSFLNALRTLGIFSLTAPDGTTTLRRTDGTLAGTVTLATDVGLSAGGTIATLVDGIAYFGAFTGNTNQEPWRSDGTPAGTFPFAESGAAQASSFAALGGAVFFGAEGLGLGRELWRTDGTDQGTAPFVEFVPGPDGSSVFELTPLGGRVVFRATFPNFGAELGVTDGTVDGTGRFLDLAPGTPGSSPSNLSPFGGRLLFVADRQGGFNRQVFTTDGTEAGTVEISPTDVEGFAAFPRNATVLGERAIFFASTTAEGLEPWITDGTAAGTRLLKDIRPGTDSSEPSQPVVVADLAFFAADDGEHGSELWQTDGTAEGTRLVSDLQPGTSNLDGAPLGSSPRQLTALNGSLYFTASNAAVGTELFRLDVDGCPTDDAKLDPGACGCGVPDEDANQNAVPDCLAGAELRTRVLAIRTLLGTLKRRGGAFTKAARRAIRDIRGLDTELLAFVAATGDDIQLADPVQRVDTLAADAIKSVRRAIRGGAGFARKRRAAVENLDRLERLLI